MIGKPIHVFAETIEAEALAQFESAMAEPYAVQGALMPDAHTGYSLPIGAVVATEGVVLPSWVGYDIGCGMCAVPTSFERPAVARAAKAIFDAIYRDIPVGFEHNKKATDWEPLAGIEPTAFVADLLAKGGRNEIGSLGGGNHFIEIGVDEGERVWIVIHSGSRNVGHKTASHYMRQASKLHTGEHLTGGEMAAALGKALGQAVRYNAVSPETYRGFGFPGADDLGNMFQFKRDFNDAFCGVRPPDKARALNPALQTFAAWLDRNKAHIPLE